MFSKKQKIRKTPEFIFSNCVSSLLFEDASLLSGLFRLWFKCIKYLMTFRAWAQSWSYSKGSLPRKRVAYFVLVWDVSFFSSGIRLSSFKRENGPIEWGYLDKKKKYRNEFFDFARGKYSGLFRVYCLMRLNNWRPIMFSPSLSSWILEFEPDSVEPHSRF